jgi:phosphatidylinositol alpha-mannosyltransferase
VYRATSWLLRPLAGTLDARIAVSEAARRTVERHFPGAYTIVPNGIEIDRFATPKIRPAMFDGDGPHVVCVGRLERRKGAGHLVRAMAAVARRAPGARLVLVGDGPDRGDLERLAADLRVDVRFAGAVPDDDVPAFFQAADVVCAPAVGDESFGLVLLEAMAAGRPIVASRIAGYAELVADRPCARLVPPGDAEALAREIVDLLEQPDACAALSAAGRDAAAAYDWTAVATRVTEIYAGAIAHRRGR